MRIYRLQKVGSIDGLVASEEKIPTPGVGEVLVKVHASSLNFRDFVIVNGWYPVPVPAGRVPLSDGAGEVQALGEGVKRFKIGDRVTFQPDGQPPEDLLNDYEVRLRAFACGASRSVR